MTTIHKTPRPRWPAPEHRKELNRIGEQARQVANTEGDLQGLTVKAYRAYMHSYVDPAIEEIAETLNERTTVWEWTARLRDVLQARFTEEGNVPDHNFLRADWRKVFEQALAIMDEHVPPDHETVIRMGISVLRNLLNPDGYFDIAFKNLTEFVEHVKGTPRRHENGVHGEPQATLDVLFDVLRRIQGTGYNLSIMGPGGSSDRYSVAVESAGDSWGSIASGRTLIEALMLVGRHLGILAVEAEESPPSVPPEGDECGEDKLKWALYEKAMRDERHNRRVMQEALAKVDDRTADDAKSLLPDPGVHTNCRMRDPILSNEVRKGPAHKMVKVEGGEDLRAFVSHPDLTKCTQCGGDCVWEHVYLEPAPGDAYACRKRSVCTNCGYTRRIVVSDIIGGHACGELIETEAEYKARLARHGIECE